VGRILAVDWGERRIGLAISDPGGILATGLPTLTVSSTAEAVARVAEQVREREAERVVVGMPLLMSGERGSAARSAQAFADALAAQVEVPIDTWDERLTSALSARRLRETGVRTGHQRGRVDQGAAVALLESFLLRQQMKARDTPP